MARGRFISNAIICDKKINALSDDTSRLAFTWLITTADAEGRTHGDPAMVRSILFPRRADVTVERMEAYIAEWAAAGIVRWYESNDDLWIDFPNFERYQIGLRKEREPSSQIPPHTSGTDHNAAPDVIQQSSGKHPAQIDESTESREKANIRQTSGKHPAQIKLIEVNGKINEANDNSAGKPRAPLTETQQRVLTSFNAKRFKNDVQRDAILAWQQYPQETVDAAIAWAATKGFALGQAIENISRALPKWNTPKPNGNGRNGNGSGSTGNAMLDAIQEAQRRPDYGK